METRIYRIEFRFENKQKNSWEWTHLFSYSKFQAKEKAKELERLDGFPHRVVIQKENLFHWQMEL